MLQVPLEPLLSPYQQEGSISHMNQKMLRYVAKWIKVFQEEFGEAPTNEEIFQSGATFLSWKMKRALHILTQDPSISEDEVKGATRLFQEVQSILSGD